MGLGLATMALGVSPAGLFPVAVAAILAVGAFAATTNGAFAVLLQATIAPEYQGRVFTLMTSVAGAMTPIGLILATPVADLAGVRLVPCRRRRLRRDGNGRVLRPRNRADRGRRSAGELWLKGQPAKEMCRRVL